MCLSLWLKCMTNYYFPIIYIVPLISIDGQASPRLFIASEIRHEKISYAIFGNRDHRILENRGKERLISEEQGNRYPLGGPHK